MNDPLSIVLCLPAKTKLYDPVPAETAESLRLHLAACDTCRQYRDEMKAVQVGLSALPRIP